MTETTHYAYRVCWSVDDGEFLATVADFPSLSWLDEDQTAALRDLVALVSDVVDDMKASGEPVPEPTAD